MILNEIGAVSKRLFIKWRRSPMFMMGGFLGPLLYLVLFGQAFNLSALLPNSIGNEYITNSLLGAPNYFSYFAIGMVAFSSVSIAIFSGVNALFDRTLGIMKRTIGTPADKSSIFAGYLLFQTILTLIPAFVVLVISYGLNYIPGLSGLTISDSLGILNLSEIFVAIVLLSLSFTSLFLAFGFISKDNNTYFGLTAVLQLPVLLTSNAMYPQSTMPPWLQSIVSVNPVTMAVNVIRENMFGSMLYPYDPAIYTAELAIWSLALILLALFIVRRSFYSES